MDSKFISNIVMSVAFIATFIGIFFFTYVKNIEQKIVKEQTANIVKDIVGDYTVLLPENSLALISMGVSNMETPDMSVADREAKENNKKLLILAGKVILAGNLIAIGIIYYLYKKQAFNIKDMIKHNLIILAFVGIIEFVFITYIARYYISADPNYIKYYVVKSVNDFIKST
jgi:hypothetical protein